MLPEPPAPTRWKVDRPKDFGVTGLLIDYLVGTHLHAPQQQPDQPRPGHTTPAPTTPGEHPTHTAINQPRHPLRPADTSTTSAGRGAVHRRLEEVLVLISRPRCRIGGPRPQRPGPRHPHRLDRLPGAWSR
ncbi:hypothetical protein ACFY2Z_40505 [Streptomyces sp. NPDC001222]|uniref:hypothetical protein n=1 Tax=Streptomyces sp. NPDC001222 TaxID=3364548 RepID=UPI0036CBD0AA